MSSGAELGARPGRELAAELARRWWGKRGGRRPWHEEARHGTAPLAGEAQSNRAWDLRKKNRKKYWNRGDNKP